MNRIAMIIAERRRLFVSVFVLGVAVMALWRGLLRPPVYTARMTLIVLESQSIAGALPAGLEGFASLAGLGAGEGFKSTPELVEGILTSRRVLLGVGLEPGGRGDSLIVDRVSRSEVDHNKTADILEAMESVVGTSTDRQTGFVTLSVEHRDSALARMVAVRLVDSLEAAYIKTARAQAEAQRKGQAARVDSARSNYLERMDRLQGWIARNGDLDPRARANLERTRLENERDLAFVAYTQAVSAYESAAARELEQTPAVTVFDKLPQHLEMKPPYTFILSVMFGLTLIFLLVMYFYARESFARFVSGRPVTEAEAEARLRAALNGPEIPEESRFKRRERVGT